MKISERTAKFSTAQFDVEDDLEGGQEVVFQGTGEVVKEEYPTLQNHTKKRVSIVKVKFIELKKVEHLA